MLIAGRLWRGRSRCFGSVFRASRRDDIEHDAIIDVYITSDSVLDISGSQLEIVVQLGIDEMRI